MAGGLTESEKERIRYHLGYMETSFAASMQLGIPRPVQTVYLLESAMTLLTQPQALQRVRCLLDQLDGLEAKLRAAPAHLAAAKVGAVELRPGKPGESYPDLLEREYVRWAGRLADVLGTPLYPYAARFARAAGAGPGMVRRRG